MPLPRIAITLGDPAGIGPETIVGAWSNPAVHQCCGPLVVGHPEIVRRAVGLMKSRAQVVTIDEPSRAEPSPGVIPCLPAGSDEALDVVAGTVDARGGQAAYDALVAAATAALAGQVDGLTTAPLNKAALWKAGHRYPGHTELLAELCDVDDFAMMLYVGPDSGVGGPAGLAIVHVTLHMGLADALAALNEDTIIKKTRLVAGVMAELKGSQPRVAVCALNPHAGEEGLFGSEERTIIGPAVERAKAEGINVVGPLPADTLMARAAAGEFDAVVAMVHDQGHIAIKLLAMHSAVNVTLGLPIVRTSVAHGTAFDRAWQGCAETSGMVAALDVAARLSGQRQKAEGRRQK